MIAGPYPQDCLDRLRDVEAVFVRGNVDRESPRAPAGSWEWLSAQLDEPAHEFLRTLPLTVSLDGQELFGATDRTFAKAGKVGLWTKADSITHFDDLIVRRSGEN